MTKNKKGLVTVGLIAGLAAVGYYFFKKNNAKAQIKQLADAIVKEGLAVKTSVLQTYEKSYLNAWITAFRQGSETFLYNGKAYSVKGGKAV